MKKIILTILYFGLFLSASCNVFAASVSQRDITWGYDSQIDEYYLEFNVNENEQVNLQVKTDSLVHIYLVYDAESRKWKGLGSPDQGTWSYTFNETGTYKVAIFGDAYAEAYSVDAPVSPASVPIPSALLLFGSGLVGMVSMRRVRSKQ